MGQVSPRSKDNTQSIQPHNPIQSNRSLGAIDEQGKRDWFRHKSLIIFRGKRGVHTLDLSQHMDWK